MLSAVWLAPLVLALSFGRRDPRVGPLDTLYFVLTAVLWLAHRFGSTWLAYFTAAYRPLRRAEPVRFWAVPCLLAVACFAIFLPPDGALPWTRAQRVVGLVIVDYLLVTYHFASQHFGMLSLYRVRAGGRTSKAIRRLDRLYALAVGGVLVIVAEIVAGTVSHIDLWVDPWLDFHWVASAAGSIRIVAIGLVAAATVGLLALEVRSPRPSFPRAAYLVGLAAMVVLAFHATSPFTFAVLWSAQHWITATGLTTLAANGGPAADGTGWDRALHAVNRRPWALVVVLAALSVLLLPFFEVEAVDTEGPLYAPRIFGGFATALRTSTWLPALLAAGFATAFLHYWLDRAVYRLSDPRVRKAARGLLEPTA